jgi:hypothetical protein
MSTVVGMLKYGVCLSASVLPYSLPGLWDMQKQSKPSLLEPLLNVCGSAHSKEYDGNDA